MIEDQATPLLPSNPLCAFLARDVLGISGEPAVDAHAVAANAYTGRAVVRYAVRGTRLAVIGKHYGQGGAGCARREYEQLLRLRTFGLDSPPYSIVRPLAVYEGVEGDVLIEECVAGESLDVLVTQALRAGTASRLDEPLARVGAFLAAWHRRTRTEGMVDAAAAPAHLERLIVEMGERGMLAREQHARLARLCSHWAATGMLDGAPNSLLHGDARSQHFLLDGESGVRAVDVETEEIGDPAADVGQLAAALRRAGWRHAGDPATGAWCAGRLLASYSGEAAEDHLAARMRFYAACEHLRRARYAWLKDEDRRRLLADVEECLRP
jgi:aminoglycoside phosphotransferase (APT) family kinase protein